MVRKYSTPTQKIIGIRGVELLECKDLDTGNNLLVTKAEHKLDGIYNELVLMYGVPVEKVNELKSIIQERINEQ